MTDSLQSLLARLEALRALIRDAARVTADPLDLSADWRQDHAARLEAWRARRDELRAQAPTGDRLRQLSEQHGLDALEEDLLLLALAPGLDQGFSRSLAGLRRSITGGHPDIDLALSLFTLDLRERLEALQRFSPQAPLIAKGLLHLRARGKNQDLMSLTLQVPERVQRALLGEVSPTSAELGHARLLEEPRGLDTVMLPPEDEERLRALLQSWAQVQALRGPEGGAAVVLLSGPSGTGKSRAAEGIAAALGRPALMIDAAALGTRVGDPVGALRELLTEARVAGALPCFDDGEMLFANRLQGNRGLPALLRELDRWRDLVVLTTSMEGLLDPALARRVVLRVELGFPTVAQRERLWRRALPLEAQEGADLDLAFVAQKYEFTGAQIEAASAMAAAEAIARDAQTPRLEARDIESAARSQLRHHLSQLAVRTVTHLTLEDIVLPEDLRRTLGSVLAAVRNRRRILEEWGFAERMTTGLGLTMLFRGDSGTGKTLSAEILASELAMPLYRVAISRIVSKYIGETEKNLEKAFREAQVAGAMLLFDEADAIFTKRVEVSSATDRYSNMEVNLLLQELERFEGVVILTTNLDTAIDDAFDRRLNYKLDFPFPDAAHRGQIWRKLLPAQAPVDLAPDHLDWLGERFELSGGSIKNVLLRAAYAAAEAKGEINIDLVEQAAVQEYRELGKLIGGL